MTGNTWIRGYAAELAGGDNLVTDAHLQDAEQMWFDMHAVVIALNERQRPCTTDT